MDLFRFFRFPVTSDSVCLVLRSNITKKPFTKTYIREGINAVTTKERNKRKKWFSPMGFTP